jgi:hypothetical protein
MALCCNFSLLWVPVSAAADVNERDRINQRIKKRATQLLPHRVSTGDRQGFQMREVLKKREVLRATHFPSLLHF